MVLKLNGIAGISVKDKLGGKKKRQRKGKVMARKKNRRHIHVYNSSNQKDPEMFDMTRQYRSY